MPRWLIAIALTWATWAATQPGVAYARSPLIAEFAPAMCSEGSQAVLLEGFGVPRARTLLSAAPAATSTTSLVSGLIEDRTAVEEDEGPIAWCISPDDPRCSPRDQGEGAPLQSLRANTPLQNASVPHFPALGFGRSVVTLRPVQLGAPRAGVGLRLERPPQH